MVGLCGVVGPAAIDAERLARFLDTGDGGHWAESPSCRVYANTHTGYEQPATGESGDLNVWAWGDVYGHERKDDTYVSRQDSHPDVTTAEYCLHLYEEEGASFAAGLNSEFVVCVRDARTGTFELFTDRLGSRPVYVCELDDTVLFSTNLQSLALHPAVDTRVRPESLQLYFALKHTPGCETPFEGIDRLPPATRTTVDVGRGIAETETYWRPEYRFDAPQSRSVESRLADVMRDVVTEQTARDDAVGLLLSGGSDSRLVLAAMSDAPVCYHINEWENAEYRAAERVADIAGCEFVYLERGEEYFRRLLEDAPEERAFVSEFQQGKPGAFRDALGSDVDAVIAGMYGDTLFKGYWLPRAKLSTPLGTLELPSVPPLSDKEQYVERASEPTPEYFRSDRTTVDLLRDGLTIEDGTCRFFGVEYGSLEQLVIADNIYPLTNQPDYLFHSTLYHTNDVHMPFLDNRVLDIHCTVPPEYQLRNLVVSGAVAELNPEMAEIPHPDSSLPIKYPFVAHYVADITGSLWTNLGPGTDPDGYQTEGPWRADGPFLRQSDLVPEKLAEHEDRIDSLSYIDGDSIEDCHRRHLEGENFSSELCRLLDVVELPVFEG